MWRVQGRVIPALYSWLATSLRSLAIILPLYYSTILTSTCATVSTDIPSYEAIHGRMPLQSSTWSHTTSSFTYYRACCLNWSHASCFTKGPAWCSPAALGMQHVHWQLHIVSDWHSYQFGLHLQLVLCTCLWLHGNNGRSDQRCSPA